MKKTLLAATSLLAFTAAHADPQATTIILNSASPMTQGIALVLANQMQGQGAQVQVLLCDKAADPARAVEPHDDRLELVVGMVRGQDMAKAFLHAPLLEQPISFAASCCLQRSPDRYGWHKYRVGD